MAKYIQLDKYTGLLPDDEDVPLYDVLIGVDFALTWLEGLAATHGQYEVVLGCADRYKKAMNGHGFFKAPYSRGTRPQ